MTFEPKENLIKKDIFNMTNIELFEIAEATKIENNIDRLKIIIKEFFF